MDEDEYGPYVIDREGLVWAVVRDGGMATRADYIGVHSYGIKALEEEKGPLVSFDPVKLRKILEPEGDPSERSERVQGQWSTDG